jgi:hypothetical protein
VYMGKCGNEGTAQRCVRGENIKEDYSNDRSTAEQEVKD